jgi:hypothetical protein
MILLVAPFANQVEMMRVFFFGGGGLYAARARTQPPPPPMRLFIKNQEIIGNPDIQI